MATEEIIDCGGIYEVHPSHGAWAVVNGPDGAVRCSFSDRDEAVRHAKELNADAQEQE